MSFLSVLKTIGNDIEKGLAIAAPIIGTFEPAAGPILTAVAEIVAALEGQGVSLNDSQLSAVVQAVAKTNAVTQHAAVNKKSG